MRRRDVLATAAAVTATGCIGPLSGDGEGEEEGPEATVRAFMDARDRGDVEEVNSLLHEDGELPEVPQDAELDVDAVEVQETEVLNRSDGRATVRAVVRVRPRSPDEGERTVETEWELRTQDGEWRIWNRTDDG
jgi:ketosteroid isomerase-like protein